jgi:hypothetical protein
VRYRCNVLATSLAVGGTVEFEAEIASEWFLGYPM